MADKSDTERKKLGKKLREAREYLDLAQDEVAALLSIPRSAISLIETGQRKVEVLELKRFSKLYQRPVAWFTGEEQASNKLPEEIEHLARAASALSKEDREELARFAEFLGSRSKIET